MAHSQDSGDSATIADTVAQGPAEAPASPREMGSAETEIAGTTKREGRARSVPEVVVLDTAADLKEQGFEARYEIRSKLGEGGMGEVLLGHDARIGRELAIKRMKGAPSGEAAERFVREARVQGQLQHPAVVPVHDLAVGSLGEAYFTMKRVRGMDLAEVVRGLADGDHDLEQRFGRRRLLAAFHTVCLAVDFAHARGVLHRDLKPANVMLGEFGEVHVLDWGLAKLIGSSEGGASAKGGVAPVSIDSSKDGQTLEGTLLGTPGYMAPEQARGEIETLDARADVYALGAILFEILYLEPLHTGNAMGRLASTLDPARFEGRARAADVAPELVAIAERALALDKSERFPTARDLADALERYLDGERDEATRRELAQGHVARATERLASLATQGDADTAGAASERAGVMRELGRALALDPTHEGALATLERMLVEAPTRVPKEARPELALAGRARRIEVLRAGAVRSLSWLATIPLVIAFGVTDWRLGAALGAALVLSSMLAVYAFVTKRTSDAWMVGLHTATMGAILTLSALLGPFVLVPSLAATQSMFFALEGSRRARFFMMALAALVIVVPFVLGALGLAPEIYSFTPDGSLLITSPMVRLPPLLTSAFLLVTSIALVVTPSVLAGRFRDELNRAEERVFMTAYHLRQLLPRAAATGHANPPS